MGASDLPLPPSLTIMAEYFGGPLWARPEGNGEPVDPSSLGIPTDLTVALLSWNSTYERLAITDFVWQVPPTEDEWKSEGALLAYRLQQTLPQVSVWYWLDGHCKRMSVLPTS